MLYRTGIYLLLSIASLVPAAAQSITPFQVTTGAYRMHMFNHGNFAVNVGGIWMPGNVCLIMRTPEGTFVQYNSEHTPELAVAERRKEDAADLTIIKGMLTEGLRFTQTVSAQERRVLITYEVEALQDLSDVDIYVSAGPGPVDMMKGLEYVVVTEEGEQRGTYGDDTNVSASGVKRVTWRGLAHRDVSWVFDQAAETSVRLSGERSNYEAHLLADRTLARGATATAICAVEIQFEEGFTGIKTWSEAQVGPVRFDICGVSGCVHHLRTDRGNILEHLNLNENVKGKNTYQSQAGTKTPGWSGVAERRPAEGEAYRATASGTVISEWQQTAVAREVADGAEVDVTYRRDPASELTDLRMLVYMAQRLEDRGQGFLVRRADGTVVTEAAGIPLRLGMQQQLAEGGLGPYTEICDFGPGDEIIIPMLHRGEIFTIRCEQPSVLSAFRFEVYFRGVWFDFTDDDLSEIKLTMKLERLPQRDGPDWFAPVSPVSGAFALNWGGMPALDRVMLYEGQLPKNRELFEGEVVSKWTGSVEKTDRGLHAEWQCDGRHKWPCLVIDLPGELVGRPMELILPDGSSQAFSYVPRVGANFDLGELKAGSTLVIATTARQQVQLSPLFGCGVEMRSRTTGDGARLSLEASQPVDALALDVAMATAEGPPMKFDTLDPRATESGLRVERDGEDVVVTSPWWQVRQSAHAGGVPSEVIFFYGSGRNILENPAVLSIIETGETVAVSIWNAARLEVVEHSPQRVVVRVTGALANREGKLHVPYAATFDYHTGYLRQRWEYDFGEGVEGVIKFGVQHMGVREELDEFLARGITRRTLRGRALYTWPWVFENREYARYMCLFDRGVEGIEFLSGPGVAQWRSQLGEPGHAFYGIDGGAIWCEPWCDAANPITISGKKTFEWYMGLANIPPQLDRRYFVCHAQAPTEDLIRHAAYHGLNVLHLSAGVTPGSYTASDVEGTKRIVALAHNYGMKTYPFDAHALLSKKVDAVTEEQRTQWATERLNRQGEREPWVYSAYGDYMCEESQGWREYMKRGFAGMIAEYGYDGLYYDFVHPILCYNDRHHPDSPHLSSAGMLEMCEWTQEAVGPDGIFSGHTGHVPTIACKNYCTIDTAYEEIGNDQVPSLGRWPEQGQFCNIRPKRLVPSFLWNSCLGPGERKVRPAREQDVRAFAARCALTGIFAPPRTAELEAAAQAPDDSSVAPFVALVDAVKAVDLTTMEFADWQHQTAVSSDNAHLRAAVFFNADRALVLVSNSESAQGQTGNVRVDVTRFGWPDDSAVAGVALPEGRILGLYTAASLADKGIPTRLGGYEYRSWLLSRVQPPGATAFCTRAFSEQREGNRLKITTSGPSGQPGKLIVHCANVAPARATLNARQLSLTTEGRPPELFVTAQFEYQTGEPVVLEASW